LVERLACAPYNSRDDIVRDHYDQDQEGQVSFYHSRPPPILEQKGVPLLESHYRFQQVGKEDREKENYEHASGSVDGRECGCEKENRQQYVYGTAIGKAHVSPAGSGTENSLCAPP
jgi:hypothetical protein